MTGLLAGFGRGLSQGAVMLQQGMAEDRAVSREEERERMRQASIERRWKVEDDRYADSKAAQERAEKRQLAQDEKADARYADSKQLAERQMSLAEQQASDRKVLERKARIEQTLSRISSKYEREGEKVDRRFDRLLDVAADDPAKKEALYKERDAAHAELSKKMSGEMLPTLKSFGEDLRGTAYETYIDEIAAMEGEAQDEQARSFLKDSGAIDVSGQLVQPTGKARGVGTSRSSFVNEATNRTNANSATAPNAGLLNPSFLSGLQSGMAGDLNPKPIDYSQITPLQRFTTATGRATTYFPGKLVDGAEGLTEEVIAPAWQWLNTPQKR